MDSMDVDMTSENKGASSVGGQAESSGGGEAPDDGEETIPSAGAGSRPSDGGGTGTGPSWSGGAGPSWSGEAGPSWSGDAGPSWSGEAGPSWSGEAGPSGSGVPSKYARGERKNKQDFWELRRKRKNKSSTGEVTAKKIKTGLAEGPDKKKKKEVEAWRSDKSITFYHSLYKKQRKRKGNKDVKVQENTPVPSKRALKRKGDHKEVPFTEAVVIPERGYNNTFSSFMKTEKPATMPPRFVNTKVQKKTPAMKVLNLEIPYQAEEDDDSSIAELLHGMSVQGPDDDNNAAAGSRRSKFNHERVVWWTTTNWHEIRKGAADYKDGKAGMVSCTRSRPIAQNRENSLSAQGTTYKRVPEALILGPPREPVNFDREDAANAAAARVRLSRRKKQRRLAVSDSDVDFEHGKEFEEFLLFRGEESVVSPVTSDTSYSSLCNSSTDSSQSSTDTNE